MNKIVKITLVFFLAMFSCEDNDSGVNITGLESKFVYTIDVNRVSFENISQDAINFEWDFGDGSPISNLINPPVKVYCGNGSYEVTLKAYGENGAISNFQSTVVINSSCEVECEENIDPANGNLNWTFLNANNNAAFDAFGDIGGGIVANPLEDAVNPTCNVSIYNKVSGCQLWAGTGIELATALDFTDANASKVFKIKVLAQDQTTDVTLRLERLPFPDTEPSQERIATITQTGQWQELTFDFSSVTTGTYKSMIIYFERNTACDGDVYYFDDIIQE